jgi:hypothetical protein
MGRGPRRRLGVRQLRPVVVGRAGVYLLETKNPQGTLRIQGGRPYLRRRLDPRADKPYPWVLRDARSRARRLHEELKRRTGHAPWVHAVAVVWCRFDEAVYETSECALLHGGQLLQWLRNREDELDARRVAELSASVRSLAGEDSYARIQPRTHPRIRNPALRPATAG